MPKGGGAIRGIDEKFSANPVTGSGSFTVQIPTTRGRSNFGPQLALSYDSGTGNGPFGFGWTLSVPAITRKTAKGLPQYLDGLDSDDFLLSDAEDLVPVYRKDTDGSWVMAHPGYVREPETFWVRDSDGRLVVHEDELDGYRVRRYRPRIEGLFARIERWSSIGTPGDVHWRSISKENVLTVYGSDADSRIADPLDGSRIFEWLMCEMRDDRGNAVLYDYKPEDGEGADLGQAHERNRGASDDVRRVANRYLKGIRYGNRNSLLVDGRRPAHFPQQVNPDWMFKVVLDYGEHDEEAPLPDDDGAWSYRPDPFSSYRSGFEVRTTRLCRRILMFHHFPGVPDVGADCLVRSMDLSYSDEVDPTEVARPVYTFLQAVTESGYRRDNGGYAVRSLPPVEFGYSTPVVQGELEEVDPESLENLPIGLDGNAYRWTDLHGEGVPGILTEQAGGWFYKRNLSPLPVRLPDGREQPNARFAALETVAPRPNVRLGGGAEIVDLAGDGQPDVVVMQGETPGMFEHDQGEGWEPFRPFRSRLSRRMQDSNARMVDVDGDGQADLLITEDDALVWHASLGEAGFGPARRVARALDEEEGPRVVFGDGTQSVQLADLSGDGGADIVRVRNGEVCYWPNLGYGRFGAKVTMDNAPWFDHPDQFDPRRVRLADIDGSGTTDVIYLHREGARLYFNQSGNAWSRMSRLAASPPIGDPAGIVPIDLLGNGTSCLVWSSSLPAQARRPMRYVNLIGEHKPHLLVRSVNNLGAETRVRYAPSTKFYLRDKRASRPWITRLAFPVHVVERTETYDFVSRNRFVTRYAYHHGHFDGEEREFRGFGMVEQWDTEELGALAGGGAFPAGDNTGAASHVPPVRTKSWFHTGVDATYQGEYWSETGVTDPTEAHNLLLPDTVLPAGLSPEEAREASRALKGSMLRQEIYADDAGPGASAGEIERAGTPFTVTERNFSVRAVQPQGGNRHAVFFTHPREAVTYHYERNPADPRIQHALTLEVDAYGNVLKQADIAYGRRVTIRSIDAQGRGRQVPNPGLAELTDSRDKATQTTPLVTYGENRVSNPVESADVHRSPLVCETVTFELTGYTPTGPAGRLVASDLVEPDPVAPGRLRHRFTNQVAYEGTPTGSRCRRPIEWVRTFYRRDDLTGLLPLGELETLALPGESYRLAFTPGLVTQVFQRPRAGQAPEALLPNPAAILGGRAGDEGGYVSDPAGQWWIPFGQSFFTTDPADSASTELAEAREHFFLPRRFRDPFDHDTVVSYDDDDLLVVETRDPLGNRIVAEANDYRVLQPRLISDPNGNRTEVAFDALGMVVGNAVMGKPPPAAAQGDTLAGFPLDLTQAQIDGLVDAANPHTASAALLQGATTRIVYDLDRFRRSQEANPDDPTRWQPACAAVLSRETHASAQLPPGGLRIQLSFSYSDGFGREIQKKVQAKSGPVVEGGPAVTPRWVGSGWTIFNNKGAPVRRYEPFFSATQRFEFGVQVGVSPVLFYDPAQRVVATQFANHTYSKVRFDAWEETSYDANDTCAPRNAETGDPRTDPDIRGYVARYFASLPASPPAPPWRTWYAERIDGDLGQHEQAAATRAADHADTPTRAHLDPLGRPFLTISRNRVASTGHDLDGTEASEASRVEFDIEGNQRAVRDAVVQAGDPLGRVVMRYAYDMLGNRVQHRSMEGGARWMLNDVGGMLIRSWDSRGHNATIGYDALRRRVEQTVRGTVAAGEAASDPRTLNRTVAVEQIEYGEPAPNASQAELDRAQRLNMRTRIFRHFDTSGVTTQARLDAAGDPVEAYDFKGNLLRSTRRFLRDHTDLPDWRLSPQLEAERFESATRWDALNRPMQSLAPYSSLARGGHNVVQPVFDEANLLRRVDVWLERSSEPAGVIDAAGEAPSPVGITDVDHDPKGQRLQVDYKNGASTAYDYDPVTFRLAHLVTRRDGAGLPEAQNLSYTYDPVGNITHVHDDAQQTVFFRNQRVEPSNDYTYDALYRLVQATGREHLGQLGNGDRAPPTAPGASNSFHMGFDHPGDGDAMGTYVERYVYDAVGNFARMQHRGSDPVHAGWTRAYEYLEPSQLETGAAGAPLKTTNRLTRTTVDPNGASPAQLEPYQHDAHGNMVRMPHLGGGAPGPNMHWDYSDRLRQTDLGGGGTAYYVYDASGQRVRKVWEKAPGLIEERIYLGGYEVFRKHPGPIGAGTPTLERETLHVMDDRVRIAMVETRLLGSDLAPRQLIRYQLGNHLGSVSLELDDASQIISYEEHFPYGGTSYQAVRAQTETPKRYRYAGKERDEESGLYVHGARYYASWLGRWTSADPGGLVDGPNRYQYTRDNPILKIDVTGTDGALAPWLALLDAAGAEAAQEAAVLEASVSVEAAGEAAFMEGGIGEAAGPLAMHGAAVIALSIVSTQRYMRRTASLVQYGNPYGMPSEDLFFPQLQDIRAQNSSLWKWQQIRNPFPTPETAPEPETKLEPDPKSKPKPETKTKEKPKEPRWGRVYVTYTKLHAVTGLHYSGRTSMVVDLDKPIGPQAEAAVDARDLNHHQDEPDENKDPNFLPAVLDRYAVGLAVEYDQRYRDPAYLAIRGREQQLIDYFGLKEARKSGMKNFSGGAHSDTNPGPHLTENPIRAVSKENEFGPLFHEVANMYFGKAPVYTGYKPGDRVPVP